MSGHVESAGDLGMVDCDPVGDRQVGPWEGRPELAQVSAETVQGSAVLGAVGRIEADPYTVSGAADLSGKLGAHSG